MAKSPDEMAAAMLHNLQDKTGKTMTQWLKVLRACKLAKHGEIVKHIKSHHGVTHGYANLIAHKALQAGKGDAPSDDALVAAQYSGAEESLRPVYDALIDAVRKFGADVEVAPKKTYVSLRRNKQFALIQASTKTRVDVGVCLKGTDSTDRLEASESFNSMVSHRIRISSRSEVDRALIGWLRRAYDKS